MTNYELLQSVITAHRDEVIKSWVDSVIEKVDSERETEEADCAELLDALVECLTVTPAELKQSEPYEALVAKILSFTTYRALNNFTPTQTTNYILDLKSVIYTLLLREAPESDKDLLIDFNRFIDDVAVLTFQNYSDSREEIILSQAHALEHDTPIVKVAEDIMLMPLMGIIDTTRAQKIIESLLDSVVENQVSIAILDMTAVPAFDTHVAHNILKTILAAKLVGTHVVVSGISPNAALTIVKLGIDLSHIQTFGTLEQAMTYAYDKSQDRRRDA